MKDLWDEHDTLIPGRGYNCKESEPFFEIFYQQRLVQFLVGLNETYAHEETQRALGVIDLNKEPLTMLAGRGQMMKGKKPDVICEPSWYKGHQKENCYKIVGYPPDFKSKKKPMQGTGFKTYVNNTTFEGTNSAEGGQRIRNVLHVPDFKFNLLLVAKLTRDLGLYSGKVIRIDGEYDGLYILQEDIKPIVGAAVIKGRHDTKLWHSRLGHHSVKILGECIRTAVHLINKLTTVVLNGKSPYEMLHGKAPKIEHLRIFGCLYYASVLPREDKFDTRTKKTVFIGYSQTQKGYRLYNLESQIFFVSRDVSFSEDIFSLIEKRHEVIGEDGMFLVDPIAHKDMQLANPEKEFRHSQLLSRRQLLTQLLSKRQLLRFPQKQHI
ncbi:uncharacterized protein LOC142172171 [Nicotiana tabacum]|uniref:Uncharacterized protein LOC142172171 n=1 Tax=Nicotiana tabacum TaxID=4097 RepID=A0AC58T4A8_TOBAC